MKKYVVIDTNVLVSALITRNENSPTVQILRFRASGLIIPVYSDEIVKEYAEVLRRKKVKLSEIIIIRRLKDIMDNGLRITEFSEVQELLPDPKDVVFYAVTLSAQDKDAFLVTGNVKHFPQKPFVVTPAELVSLIQRRYRLIIPSFLPKAPPTLIAELFESEESIICGIRASFTNHFQWGKI